MPTDARRLPIVRGALFVALCALAAGCAGLQWPGMPVPGGQPPTPHVSVAEVRLVRAPTAQMMAGYYCARVAPNPLLCLAFGGVPSREQMTFAFDVGLDVENVAEVPLPVVSALVAFTAYPDARGQQNLGAACITMCDDPATCPQDTTTSCESSEPEIRDLSDFGRAAAGFLLAVATGEERLENLRIRTIAPRSTARVSVRLQLDPEQVLGLVRQLATESLQAISSGRRTTFTIPYQVEGSIWLTVEHFGRFAASFPTYRGEWVIR